MRTTDERVAAVRCRSRRLRRRRADLMLAAPLCLAATLLAGFAGGHAVLGTAAGPAPGAGLFGSSSLLGPSAGGYVLVAVVSFALAVLVTVFIMLRRRRQDEREESSPDSAVAREPDDAPSKTAR